MFFFKNEAMDAFRWSKYLIVILSIYWRLDFAHGLRCYCNFESCPNSTCETDGYCYAASALENGLEKHTYHCWDRENIFPPGDKPIWCRKEESVDIYCCATDYCNRDYAPGTARKECVVGFCMGSFVL